MSLVNISIFLLSLSFVRAEAPTKSSPEIAIVGGGISGASAAHFLHKLFGTPEFDASIDVYERSAIGGRLKVIEVDGHQYEAGGSVIHSKNKYMVNFTKMLGLHYEPVSEGLFGIYNGKDYAFKESEWSVVTMMKMFWRYGSDIFRLKTLINDMIAKLSRIYVLQDKGYAYSTVENLMTAMDRDFMALTNISIGDYMRQQGYSQLIISELADAAMRVNYGQSVHTLPAFVGLVSLAGVGYELWHVKEGNYQVAASLFKQSNTNIRHKNVSSIERTASGQYLITDSNSNSLLYDIIIIASPMTSDLCNIKFKGFTHPPVPIPGKYHRTVATFVQGIRNSSAIDLPDDTQVESILAIGDYELFNSLSELSPVNAKKPQRSMPVHKIFSKLPLTDSQLDGLFIKRLQTKVVDWLAYPHYSVSSMMATNFAFKDAGIYYTSPIENTASAMEMSAISGRNAALLAYNQWFDKLGKTDEIPGTGKLNAKKNEL